MHRSWYWYWTAAGLTGSDRSPVQLWTGDRSGSNLSCRLFPQFARHASLNWWASGCSTQHVSYAWIKLEWLKWTELNRPPKSREWLDCRSVLCMWLQLCCRDHITVLPTCVCARARRPPDKTGDGEWEWRGGRHAWRQCSCSSRQIRNKFHLIHQGW